MKNNDKFNEKIYDYFKENNEVPQKITQSIYEAKLKKDNRKIFSFYNIRKVAVAAISIVTISTGVVFAKDITQFVKNIFKDNAGVYTATQNGYIESNPKTIYSNSNNTKTQMQEMIMDDYTLDLTMFIEFEKDIDVTGIESFKIPDLIITDENNNILYTANNETTKQFCESKGISYQYENLKNIISNTSSSIFIWNADKNYATIHVNLSASDNKFPKSTTLYITFNTINMAGNDKNYSITGDWNNIIKVPEKFVNRSSTLYKAVDCNNKNVYLESIKAEVYETGMNFEMSMYWGDYETEHKKAEEIRKKDVLASQLINQELSYVENEKGERFYPAQSSASDGGYSFNTDGKLHKWETFTLTKFDMTDKLKVVLTTINKDQIIINLEK